MGLSVPLPMLKALNYLLGLCPYMGESTVLSGRAGARAPASKSKKKKKKKKKCFDGLVAYSAYMEGICPSKCADDIDCWLDLAIASMQKTMIARRSRADSTNRADGLDQLPCYLCPVPKALIAPMDLCPCT